ncbi:ATP-binding protein [Oerskovia jenensis]|uniref:ATP-binding protein n=1 Tax=Oerskovia jenensis TaxID=162169 RepID=UPI0036DAE524
MPQPVSQRRVDPDPSITSAIGRHHSLATAIADLVDNSIDAGARHVLVRFVTRNGQAIGLEVIDDGTGMDTVAIDAAMTYARKRDYEESALGHFGIGLKAASLSQADTLIVWSRRYGAPAVGRRIRRSTIDTGPIVESYSAEDAETRLSSAQVEFDFTSGTLVEWGAVRTFLRTPDDVEQIAWLEKAIEDVLTHLGLVLHRILARRVVTVTIEISDEFGSGAPRVVTPRDPFGYVRSGAAGFPVEINAVLPEGRAIARAHVWPSDSRSSPGYVLTSDGPLETQGLYVYRHDRLLQAGGWCDLTMRTPELVYARLELDIGSAIERHVAINPEKTGVVLDSTFKDALLCARSDDGRTFRDFLEAAEGRSRESRRRTARPVMVVEPRGGLPSSVLGAFESAMEFDLGEESVEIRWVTLPPDEFFRVDRDARRMSLNLQYREAVVGRRSLDPTDAPVVKALIFLLLNQHFTGTLRGAREKRLETAWQTVLVAAAQAQMPVSDERE